MKKAKVFVNDIYAGILEEDDDGQCRFTYLEAYEGSPISLTMPVCKNTFTYKKFPPFFEGLLPEGLQLDSLLRQEKIDKYDYFNQLLAVGSDLVGAVTVQKIK